MPDYTNILKTFRKRRHICAVTASVFSFLGSLMAVLGFVLGAGNAQIERMGSFFFGVVIFGIGCLLLIIGIILFIVTAALTSQIKKLKTESQIQL